MLKALCIWLHLCHGVAGEARVIDGDTLDIIGVHVRLNGIDAMELGTPHGDLAKLKMQHLVSNHPVTCHLTGKKSYDRMVGTCYVRNDIDIAAEMIRLGYALDCAKYSGGRYRHLEPQNIRLMLKQQPYC